MEENGIYNLSNIFQMNNVDLLCIHGMSNLSNIFHFQLDNVGLLYILHILLLYNQYFCQKLHLKQKLEFRKGTSFCIRVVLG